MFDRMKPGGKKSASGDRGAALVRQALARAASAHEPRIEGLLAAVPAMMAEAHRRRRLESTPAARISFAASAWLPRLAATAALLVAIAALWPSQRARETASTASMATDSQSAIDSWVVTGRSPSSVQDPVLDALVR